MIVQCCIKEISTKLQPIAKKHNRSILNRLNQHRSHGPIFFYLLYLHLNFTLCTFWVKIGMLSVAEAFYRVSFKIETCRSVLDNNILIIVIQVYGLLWIS